MVDPIAARKNLEKMFSGEADEASKHPSVLMKERGNVFFK